MVFSKMGRNRLTFERLPSGARKLLLRAGFHPPYRCEPIAGGANNRVFRVTTCNGIVLLKMYFQHPDDRRNRVGAEYAFTQFAWDKGIRCIPKPFATDQEKCLAVYEFVHGSPVSVSNVSRALVQQAIDFFLSINSWKHDSQAVDLPPASESCFSLGEHLACIDQRLSRMREIQRSDQVACDAAEFVHSELIPFWDHLIKEVRRCAERIGIREHDTIPFAERCLSPSDFGFHNALLCSDGSALFIDFEYAGWDDPAKLICDFFCQPKVPISMDFMDFFLKGVTSGCAGSESVRMRRFLLQPIYRVKWCCIMLNDFLQTGCDRREFAGVGITSEIRQLQLRNARDILRTLKKELASDGPMSLCERNI